MIKVELTEKEIEKILDCLSVGIERTREKRDALSYVHERQLLALSDKLSEHLSLFQE